ncbi:toll-like receptor 13 [Anneissia japonica]|uniref:toll-like receptor 13 n=1 Tax=Anneissia japonica TaxID=1529436 RepID=UPI00142586DA|nr:toll-like receptor 13 [Anneissia japonica]
MLRLWIIAVMSASTCLLFHPIHTLSKKCFPINPYRIIGSMYPNETRCPMECLCEYCPYRFGPNFHNLRYQHQADCRSKKISKIPFTNLAVDLTLLWLDKNNIQQIKNDTFYHLRNLLDLSLAYNNLLSKTVYPRAFRGLFKLRLFYLQYNTGLNVLRKEWFTDMLSLKTLYVQYSSVVTVEPGVFDACSQLSSVSLYGNKIKTVSVVFRSRPNLKWLSLHDNIIESLHDDAFLGSNNLTVISLHNNHIATVSESLGLQNLPQLSKVLLSSNHLSCDCQLLWFRRWLNMTSVEFTDIDQTNCSKPSQLAGTNILKFNSSSISCTNRTLMITLCTCVSFAVIVFFGMLVYIFRWDIRYWNQRRLLRQQYEQLQNEGPPPIDGVQVRYDAFVSYNSKDRDWVLKTALPILEGPEFNFRLCVDFRDFIVGGAITDNISDAIKYSRKMLVVVTENFAKSEWCYFEMEMARTRMFDNHEDILVVVILEHVASRNMPTLLQKILRKKTYIEWTQSPDGQKVFWTRLATALNTPNAHHDRLIN